MKSKRSGHARRLNKSEPTGHFEDSFDGAQDSDVTAVSSSEGQPLLQGLAV